MLNTMDFDLIRDKINELAEVALEEAVEVRAEAVGLDRRVDGTLMIGDDFVAVTAEQDPSLQYYGGFEYIRADDPDARMEVGDYVFYRSTHTRVQTILDRFEEQGL